MWWWVHDAGMSDVPQGVGAVSGGSAEVELSEQQLFQLATGEAVTVRLCDQERPHAVALTVAPPVPLADRE